MKNIIPVAFAYLDHENNVCYTSNLEGPLPELEAISRYGRKGAMIPLLTEQQHRASVVLLLGDLKNLLDKPDKLKDAIDQNLKNFMR